MFPEVSKTTHDQKQAKLDFLRGLFRGKNKLEIEPRGVNQLGSC